MIVLAAGVALLLAGYLVPLSRRAMILGIAALIIGPLALHLILPAGSAPLRLVGGSLRGWAVLAMALLVAGAYWTGLRQLRARASDRAQVSPAAPPLPVPTDALSAPEVARYARHIVLREIGGAGQKRLKAARVLVVGAGGLGSPALLYLAAAGVGRITVVDDDIVSDSNLQRQIVHTEARIGQPKVASAVASVQALNHLVEIEPVEERLTEARARELFADHDLILDGSDNFATRYMVNRAAVAAGKPLISAAISQWEGQIGLFHPGAGYPCYQCVFPEEPAAGLAPTCAEAGVIAPLPGVVGSLMALEAVKHLTGAGQTLAGRLMIFDGLWGESRSVSVSRQPGCPVCGTGAGAAGGSPDPHDS